MTYIKVQQTTAQGLNPACCLFWGLVLLETIMFIVFIVCGCFHATVADLSSYNRHCTACNLALHTKRLPTSAL